MTPFIFLLLSLATWRLSYMFVKEAGPLDVFKRIRRVFYAGEYDPSDPQFDAFSAEDMEWWTGHEIYPTQGLIGGILSCIYCCSVWVGMFFTSLLLVAGDTVTTFIVLPFALSCVSVMVEMWRMKTEETAQYYDEITEEDE